MAEHGQGLLAGKRGIVLGVANNRSIAWGIARSARAQSASVRRFSFGSALNDPNAGADPGGSGGGMGGASVGGS